MALVERDTGRLLGSVDELAAHRSAHPGAVYLHQGQTYLVDTLDGDAGVALLVAAEPDWTTSARELAELTVRGRLRTTGNEHLEVSLAQVQVRSQVTGYRRTSLLTGQVLDELALDLPARELTTRAVLVAFSDGLLTAAAVTAGQLPGAIHAVEHAASGLLPLFATCDRWDLGAVSAPRHPDTGRASVLIYDAQPGGAGFAERGFTAIVGWLSATADLLAGCPCPAGCPSCVQSPACGSGNEPLDKGAARRLLARARAELSAAGPARDG